MGLLVAFLCLPLVSGPRSIIAEQNASGFKYTLNKPAPSYPPAALKKLEQGTVALRIVVKNGAIIDVTPTSGPSTLARYAATWAKRNYKFKPGTTGTFVQELNFVLPNQNLPKIRIVVKNGKIVEVTPVSGSPQSMSAAVDWVKKKWVPTPGANGTFILPVKFATEPTK